jgi:hypothetical protein
MDSDGNSSISIHPTLPNLPTLPPGYSYHEFNGTNFAVPNYLIPATNNAIDAFNAKKKIIDDDIISNVKFTLLMCLFLTYFIIACRFLPFFAVIVAA